MVWFKQCNIKNKAFEQFTIYDNQYVQGLLAPKESSGRKGQ